MTFKEWLDLLEYDEATGRLNLEQLEKELSDFTELIDRHTFLVELTTGLSYPTYTKEVLAVAVKDRIENLCKDCEKNK